MTADGVAAVPDSTPGAPIAATSRRAWTPSIHTVLAVGVLTVVLVVLVWQSLPLVVQGLSSADDAFFAEWAKALGQGRGYGAPMTDSTMRLFDPTMGGGPALLLPMTGVLLMTGPAELVPGSVTLALFIGQLAIATAILARRFGVGAASGFMALLVLVLMVATEGFYIFGKYLGEPWTLGFLLVGSAALVVSDRRAWIVVGAVSLSLAFLTKQVGMFGAAGIALVWIAHQLSGATDRRAAFRRVALFIGAAILLPAAWELVKLVTLGPSDFLKLTIEELVSGPRAGGRGATEPIATIVAILQSNYIAPAVLAVMCVGSVLVLLALRRWSWRHADRLPAAVTLAALLWVGALGQLTYVVISRSDWPRYLWLTVTMACAAALVPFLALPTRPRSGVLVLGAVAVLILGLTPLRPDPLAPSARQQERSRVVAYLAADPDLPFAAVKWSSIYDVVFPLRDEGRWVMDGDLRELAPQDFSYVVNRAFTDDYVLASPVHQAAQRRCAPVIDGERLRVLRCGEPFWADYLAITGGSGPDPAPPPVGAGAADLLVPADTYVPGAATTLAVVPEAPPGGSAWSLGASITDLAPATASFSGRKVRLDLSDVAADGKLQAWVHISSTTHLAGLYVVFFSGDAWAAYGIAPGDEGTWMESGWPLASPTSSSGTMDWSAVSAIYLRADAAASGPYSGRVLWHDVRVVATPAAS